MSDFWKITKQDDLILYLEDPLGFWSATVKWDGCIDLTRLFNLPLPITNDPDQLVDMLHLCDINEAIERLQALKELAKAHFAQTGEDYQYWEEA